MRKGPSPSEAPSELDMITRYSEVAGALESLLSRWDDMVQKYEPVLDLFSVVALSGRLHSEAEFLFLTQALEVYHARCPDLQSMILATAAHRARVRKAISGVPEELRPWVKKTLQSANYKRLDERLTDIFSRFQADYTRVVGDIKELPERIRHTRNYLTHYSSAKPSEKLLKPGELVEVNWKLRTFLWVCLLRELGFPEVSISRFIRKYAAVSFVAI